MPDYLAPGLDVLFVGINPGRRSAATGHHYAGPGNHFWPLLYELIGLAESFGLSKREAESGLKQMLAGAVATMLESGLDGAAVQDLIPVKPLADLQQTILEAYRMNLKEAFEKIKP